MTKWCPGCERWSALPLEVGEGDQARVECEHCGAPLDVESRYGLCPNCGRRHRVDYDSCPFKVEGVVVSVTEGWAEKYTVEAQRRKARRGDEHYWQLFIDYQDRPSPTSLHDEQSPHPALTNGGGDAADAYETDGAIPHESGGNGNGNGYGGSGVDLVLMDAAPIALFSDGEASTLAHTEALTVSAGSYNEFEYELIQDPSRLAAVAEMLAGETVIGVDTETTGLDPHTSQLLLLQVATSEKVYIVDCKRLVPLALKPLLENPQVLKVAQNAKFEYEMLRQQAGITLSGMFDTMLAERLVTAGIGREISLKALAQKYIGAVLDKSVRESFHKLASNGDAYLAPEQLHYAARDAFVMRPIWQQQLKELKRHRLEQVADIEFRCIAAVGDMELAGVRIDKERWRKIIDEVAVQRDRTASELAEMLQPASMQATMFGVSAINLNSNSQLIEVFGKLGVELPDTMEATLVKHDHPGIKKLLEYRGFEKTLSAFGENVLSLINPKTGRIHPDFNQYGADTGRFSCTKPNVQQIPATSDFRKCFMAAPGYKLVTCDYSQAELRILAELSGDEGFVNAFTSGQDLHTLTASQMFGVPLEEVQKPQRNAAKAINFGLAYGMGPGGLAPRLGVSLEEAKDLIARYFRAYPGIQKWLDKAAKDSVRLGYSITPLGRKRFYNIPDQSLKQFNEDEWRKQIAAIERQGKNSPIQGSFVGSTRIFDKLRGYVTIGSLYAESPHGFLDVDVWDGRQFAKGTVVYSGVKPIVRITLYDGNYIECSPGHRFLVRNCNGRDMWKLPGQLKAQDRIVLTEAISNWSCGVTIPPIKDTYSPPTRPISLSRITDLVEMGEWLGRLASDGSLGLYRSQGIVRLLVAEHEEAILTGLESTSQQIGNVRHSVRVTETQPQRLHTLALGSLSLYEQLASMGVKERIPDCVWKDSRLLAAYLRGMFDGDGTVHPDGAVLIFGQGHKHLKWAREIQQALLLFGVRSRVGKFTGRIHVKILKKDMPLFCKSIGFMNPAKQEKASRISAIPREKTYGRAVRVKGIEFSDEHVDMYDVVNSESGRFMANGMIVHNSNADMTKLALINLRQALRNWDAQTVNTVHDEIVVEVREDQAEEVQHIVEREMVRAGQAILKVVPIVAEASLADYWSK